MPIPTMTPVTSSNLHSVGRDDEGHLYVTFKGAGGAVGRTYRYPGAAADHHDALVGHQSPGSYFHANIRGGSVKGEPVE